MLSFEEKTLILTFANGKDRRAVYTSEIAAGLEYGRTICGWDWNAAIEYELQSWINLQDFQNFAVGSTILRNNSSLLLHGLFARVGVAF